MQVIQKLLTSPANNGKVILRKDRDGQSVQLFVIHKQAGNGMLYNFFQGGSRGTSTHYQVLKNGQVYQFVPEEWTAFANGDWGWNVRGLSIEFEGNDTDAVTNEQYENCSQLIAQLSKKYNFPCEYRDSASLKNYSTRGITIHKNITSTACPANVDYMRVINRAREILNVTPPNMDTVVYGNETWTKDDLSRIVSNLQGTPGTYDWEWEKFKKNPAQTLKDILTWKDYKNKTAEQLVAVRNERDTLKGLIGAKDTQISSLSASVSDLNTKHGVDIEEKKQLLLKVTESDDKLSDLTTVFETYKKDMEEVLKQKESAIEVLTKNNERLQEELRVCQASGGGGVSPDPSITILARFIEWIRKLLAKIPSKKS
jgi:hypothetical protein